MPSSQTAKPTGRSESERYLGAMTGTSLDGLDLALVQIHSGADSEPQIQIEAGETISLPDTLQLELKRLTLPETARSDDDADTEIERLGRADHALGMFIGSAIRRFITQQGLSAPEVRAIGSHGQTVRHRPQGALPFTLQIGDPNQIAEQTGVCTVADFRRRDMAAGGQGAPLVPLFHEALFERDLQKARAEGADGIGILNIGGIANLSVLTGSGIRAGFDTGPGNGLLDAWIQQHIGQSYDADGTWARSGQSDGALLDRLLADPYFAQAAPKSTGREQFSLPWLEMQLGTGARPAPESVQATLLELTARSVAKAIETIPENLARVLVCGGGRHNGWLMQRLAQCCAVPVLTTDEVGIDGDSLEAAAFAWFAYRTIKGLPGNAPTATGASGPRVLGGIYPP